MLVSKTYTIPNEQIENLKDAFYDLQSYQNIISDLIKNNPDEFFTYAIFEDFRKHYKNAIMRYDKEKIEFEFNFVKPLHPNAQNWNVTFGDSKVNIKYIDEEQAD